MQLLLLSPTANELNAIQFHHPALIKKVCGVGGIETTRFLYENVNKPFKQIILFGIAGGDNSCKPGQVVKIADATQGDLGVFEKNGFTAFTSTGLIKPATESNHMNQCVNVLPHLASKKALSTNILFEDSVLNQLRHDFYQTQAEDMEGAAFHTFCEQKQISFLHLRAISNAIGERDKSKWEIELALENLNIEISSYLNSLL